MADAAIAIQALADAIDFSTAVKDLSSTIEGQPLNIRIGSFFPSGNLTSASTSPGVGSSNSLSGTSGIQSQANSQLSGNSNAQNQLGTVLGKVGTTSASTGSVKFQFDSKLSPREVPNSFYFLSHCEI